MHDPGTNDTPLPLPLPQRPDPGAPPPEDAAAPAVPDAQPTPRTAEEQDVADLVAGMLSTKARRNRAVPIKDIHPHDLVVEVEKLDEHKGSWGGAILVLAVSLLLFAGAESFSDRKLELGLLIGVIFFHELGHYLGMRLFGYRNVRMFFIPFLGAAVSGHKTHVDGWKEAVVSLLGPLPGIALGTAFFYADVKDPQEWLWQCGRIALLLNVLNLLPMMPLDGGHFWRHVLFARSPVAEGGFQAVTGLGLAAVSFYGGLWLLGVVGVMVGMGGLRAHFNGKIARTLRPRLRPDPSTREDDEAHALFDGVAPVFGEPAEASAPKAEALAVDSMKLGPDEAAAIRDAIARARPSSPPQSAALLASSVKDIWDRVLLRPPGLVASMSLMLLYFGGLALGVIAFAGGHLAHQKLWEQAMKDGHAALESGDAAGALAGYREAERHAPRLKSVSDWVAPDQAMALGRAHYELKEWEEALKQFGAAVVGYEGTAGEDSVEVAEALLALSDTLLEQGRVAEAKEILTRVRKIQPGLAPAADGEQD